MFLVRNRRAKKLIHEFHLSPRGSAGVFCDEGGAFIGAVPMLARTRGSREGEWRPRDCGDLSQEMSAQYGLPVDMSSKRGGLTVIAKALNEGDVARAQIATVLLRVPDPPSLSKGAPSRQGMIKLAGDLRWSSLLKADWDPDEHPRWPAGAPDSQGGQFAPKGEGDETGASPISSADATGRAGSDNPRPDRADTRIQLADAGISDASDDPVGQAAARAAEAGDAIAQTTPTNSEHEGFWQRLGSELSEKTKAWLEATGRAEIEESNANLAGATATVDAIAHAVHAFSDYRAQPWLGPDGRPMQVPVINTGDPFSDASALIWQRLLDPNAPLTRPATNSDWVDPLVNLASLAAMAIGPALRLAGTAAEAIEGADVAALSAETTTYRATLGNALSNNYRATFFKANPELEGQVVVHHGVPQLTLKRYPSEITESEIHSIENLRGIPKELNSDLHLKRISKGWTQFYAANPNATREQLLQKATEVDLKYGGLFKPPVGGGE
jgi:hypothetical protein